MIFRKYVLEIITLITILVFIALVLFTSSLMTGIEFPGSDTEGSSQVAELAGRAAEDYQPLIRQWAPPNNEIESALFALQAAVGGLMVGWVFGYWKGQKKTV